jgi:hypothetical protein
MTISTSITLFANERFAARFAAAPSDPLANLLGTWVGTGFNQIWRPLATSNNLGTGDHFLELNLTSELTQFSVIRGNIPNRGLGAQPDRNLSGLTYLQQVSDSQLNTGIHIEPGLWISVPASAIPATPASVARLASIPHGTTILLQGTAVTGTGNPTIPAVSISPISPTTPTGNGTPFPETDLTTTFQTRQPSQANPPGSPPPCWPIPIRC